MNDSAQTEELSTAPNRVYTKTLNHGDWQEHYITVVPDQDISFASIINAARAAVKALKANIVSLEVFGPDEQPVNGYQTIQNTWNPVTFPVSWIQTHLDDHQELFGVNLWAVSNVILHPILANNRIIGNYFDTPAGRICKLGQLVAGQTDRSRPEQTQEVFHTVQQSLQQAGMTYLNVVRTWFYNNDILSWYDDFNQVRTDYYRRQGVFDKLVPASTGIGGRNPHNSELLLSCLAIDPIDNQIAIKALNSPLQCPAPQYGSSFSRAIEIRYPSIRRISVSGTASIAPGGESVHLNDIDAQIDLTMRVVLAILQSRNMNWNNVIQGIAYLRRADDAKAFENWRRNNNVTSLPVVVTPNIVCRDDLLFEIEVEAASLD